MPYRKKDMKLSPSTMLMAIHRQFSVVRSPVLWPAVSLRYTQNLYSDSGICTFSAFPVSQWHFEENSSYTATALYGNLTRFHKQFAYLILNVELILFFLYFFKN